MKYLVAILSFLFLSASAYSQTRQYKDLVILYADGTYDSYKKLVKQAEKYTLKDATKKDPKPYFWMAKGLFKISTSGTDDDNYKNAYKDAIKFLGKGIKYDLKYNDGDYTREESEFVSMFQMTLFETANNEISGGGFKRGFSWVLKYSKITNNMVGANYLMGACKYEAADKTTAREYWKKAEAELKTIESIDSWSQADKDMLKYGVLYSAGALKRSRQEDKAKTLVNKVAQWFEEDEDWEALYDEIVNRPKDKK
ncbi:MAG: hypothetical protein AB8B56_10800 [Crocinitomicaceae bacterium]